MAFRGKIACHFPDRANPNADVQSISFLPEGTDPSTISDITDIPKVKAVYAIPAGVTSVTLNDLPNYLVWEYRDPLAAGSTNVAIEFVPSTDIQLSSVSIFTDSNYSTANGARVKIMHESGIYVGAADGDVISAETTLYGLTGREHTASFSLTLYAGNKYYIVYQGPTNSDFYPAYYDGSTNGKYKAYANTTAATQITPYPNINSIYSFMPPSGQRDLTEDLLKTIMDAPNGSNIFWLGNDVSPNGNVILKSGYLSSKQMSTPNTQVTATDSDIWGYSANTYFIWHNKQNTNVYDRIYQKNASTTYDGTFTITSSSNSTQQAETLVALKNGNGTYAKVLTSTPNPNNGMGTKTNHLLSIKNGYAVGFDSIQPSSAAPSGGWKDYTFYFLKQNIDYSSSGGPNIFYGDNAVCIKSNGTWDTLNQYDIAYLMTYLNDIEISSVVTQIAITSLLQLGQQVSNDGNFRNASVVTGSKYYLKINGNEV